MDDINKQLSTIRLSWLMDKLKFDSAINEFLQKQFGKGLYLVNDKADIFVTLDGEPKIEFQEWAVQVFVPVSIQLNAIKGLPHARGTGQLTIGVKIDYPIGPDFNVQFRAEVISMHWRSFPVVRTGFLSLPLKLFIKPLNRILRKQIKAGLEAFGSRHLQLRKRVPESISLLNLIIKQNPVTNHRGQLSIYRVQSDSPLQQGSNVQCSQTITASVSLTADPNTNTDPPQIPAFLAKAGKENKSHIHPQLRLKDELLTRWLNATQTGFKLQVKGREIVFRSYSLTFKKDCLRAIIFFDGEVHGQLLLECRLTICKGKKCIEATIDQLQIKTGNPIFDSAAFIMKSRIRRMIEDKISENIDTILRAMLDNNLAESKELQNEWGVLPSVSNLQGQWKSIHILDGYLEANLELEADIVINIKEPLQALLQLS